MGSGSIFIFATDKPTRTASPLRHCRVSEKRRQINRARKSAGATRVKKALTAINTISTSNNSTEVESLVKRLISNAYSEIDKAVAKGVIHRRTGNHVLPALKRNSI